MVLSIRSTEGRELANAVTLRLASDVRRGLAGGALTQAQAKLYSQRLRRDMGQAGLASFQADDVGRYLDEAALLIECALLERRADAAGPWRDGVKRAAELFEWLSQPSLRPHGAPLPLLAAAAYQVAGYPAMALGHLHREPEQGDSQVLNHFLRADFPKAMELLTAYWDSQFERIGQQGSTDIDMGAEAVRQVLMCIGVVCTYFQTGNAARVDRALSKLDGLSDTFLLGRDTFSFLLAKLTAAAARQFVESSLWPSIDRIAQVSSPAAGVALVQFARLAYVNRRALVWPAQERGIARLAANSSFVLCTPTGSGKTTVATVAIVQALFQPPTTNPEREINEEARGNLVLYVVPSRALAAEVEARLSQDLRGIAADPIVVTGLYGGTDWGPTDAWIQTDRPTIVICTFEKADALLRYVGPLFLERVRLVVIDETHMVEQDVARSVGLDDGSSRSYRLEQLGARLFSARDRYAFRVVALSAVAARAAPALARWISGSPLEQPQTSTYRSTRQMLGRLEVGSGGQFRIRYDLMDGRSLRFEDEQNAQTPYVLDPFPAFPGNWNSAVGPEIAMRAPTLWAALHLAAERPDGSTPSVLISVTQNIEAFAASCAEFIEALDPAIMPNFRALDANDNAWTRCLASAADYFTRESVEYRLLAKGIAVHHGKMPGLLARRLKMAIDRGSVRVVIATSTLSEGVNIPVSYLLIPSVCRGAQPLSVQEFVNLMGRAGRPGVSPEGSTLVVLHERLAVHRSGGRTRQPQDRQWNAYTSLLTQVEQVTASAGTRIPEDHGSSPLARLLDELERAWKTLTGNSDFGAFASWLEETSVPEETEDLGGAYKYLDSLDSFLIAAIVEIEEMEGNSLGGAELENELKRIWRRTYAAAVAREEERLEAMWLLRGKSIPAHYPDGDERRQIYKTSLPPRSARVLIKMESEVRSKLLEGVHYAIWNQEQKFQFIRAVLECMSRVPAFRISTSVGRQRNFQDWPQVLRWWVAKGTLERQPAAARIGAWYDFVAQNFVYRGTWGLGSIIGLSFDRDVGASRRALRIDDWPESGLPWIAFWLKELLTWGTLEPVAAFLLARGLAVDRPEAEAQAGGYYADLPLDLEVGEWLNPRRIREWIEGRRGSPPSVPERKSEIAVQAVLQRPAFEYVYSRVAVTPLWRGKQLIWIDAAGYDVARSVMPDEWPQEPSSYVFTLDVLKERVIGECYLHHVVD